MSRNMALDSMANALSNAAAISLQPAPDFFYNLVIAHASVGVAHVDLVEHVIEC
jgi:hypothetical protein